MANGRGNAAPIFATIPLALGLVAALGGDANLTSSGLAPKDTAEVVEFSLEDQRLITEHVFGGLPSTKGIHARQAYVRSYLAEARVPSWVAYHLIADYRRTPPRTGRFSSFRTDPDIDDPVRDDDYTGLFAARGYARGHLAPYGIMGGDRDGDGLVSPDDPDEDQTVFEGNYMSNIAPQHHAEFNGSGGLWFELERMIQDDWVDDQGMELWVFAGTVIGRGNHELVGPDHDIVVPPMFFKIVIREISDDGEEDDLPRVLAFLFPHQRVRHGELTDFLVSVDIIEVLTGLDFFSEFGEEVETVLEDVDTIENWEAFLQS